MKSDPVEAAIEAMQSKAKPTKAANRAAKVVMDKLFNDYPYEAGWAARLIDLETGLPELIDACRLASCVEQANLDDLRAQGELEDGANICACKQSIAIYKAAIAKAEGT